MIIKDCPWLWNSIKSNKTPLTNQHLKIYVCGPTVYDDIHIGNLRPAIIFDFFTRYLSHLNIPFTYIQNITDIDDKIIKKAIENNTTEKEITDLYKHRYFDLLDQLNINKPSKFVCVTDEIPAILDVIQELMDKKFAYVHDQTVWFDISKAQDSYMELSNQSIDNLTTVDAFDLNFALWKKTDLGQTWDSPWGAGRPGWHLECFVFIKKFFGSTIDIHGGGVDLKFPHHENENILSHAIFSKSLSQHWMHVGHLCMHNEKMSKSSGKKLLLVKDLLSIYDSNVLRYIFLLTSYEKPFDIDEDKLKQFASDWSAMATSISCAKSHLYLNGLDTELSKSQLREDFLSALSQNFNLPLALSVINELKLNLLESIKQRNYSLISTQKNDLFTHLDMLGFKLSNIHSPDNLSLLDSWKNQLDNKQYAEADSIRTELKHRGLLA